MASPAVFQSVPRERDAGQRARERESSWAISKSGVMEGVSVVSMQPLLVAKTLTQVAYEPVEPVLGRSLFRRRPGYYYPNIFKYLHNLRRTEGWGAIFSGCVPRVLSHCTYTIVEKVVDEGIRAKLPFQKGESTTLQSVGYEIFVGSVSKGIALVASQPMHVVMIRMICSIVSKDKPYQTFFGTIREIYDTEGLKGFFSGLAPRIIAEIIGVTVYGLVLWGFTRLMNEIEHDRDALNMIQLKPLVQYSLASTVYPYNLASTVYAASCKGLHLGLPAYKSWSACKLDLSVNNQLHRGAAYFYRRAVI